MAMISNIGLGLMAFLCCALTFLLGHVFDFCNLVNFPDVVDKGGLTVGECESILKAGVASASNQKAAQALMFVLTLAARIEAAFFIGTAVACIYTIFAVSAENRASIHLLLVVVGVIAFAIDGANAGLIPFGQSPFIYEEAKGASVVLMGLWSAIMVCNLVGFLGAASADKSKKA